MMLYQIVQPFFYEISADSVNNAIKNFVKIHNNLNITNLIIANQHNKYQAQMKYFDEEGKHRVGINIYPYNNEIIVGPSYATYIETNPYSIPLTHIYQPTTPLNVWNNNHPPSPYISPVFIPRIIEFINNS